jgi:hypothetical protein
MAVTVVIATSVGRTKRFIGTPPLKVQLQADLDEPRQQDDLRPPEDRVRIAFGQLLQE